MSASSIAGKHLLSVFFRRPFFALVLIVFSISAFAVDEKAPQGHAIGSSGFNDLLGKQIKSGTFTTEQQSDGSFLLTNKMQTVSAHITDQGTQFNSIGNSAGKGGFGLQLTQWGRESNLQSAESSKIYRDGDVVFHTHTNGIAEKFSNNSDGIQQDFIIPVKPEGAGSLHVQLQVSGAKVVAKDNGAVIALNSGRQLTYDRLTVTDSAGKNIPAQITLAQTNVLDVVVDDAMAHYPLTIDPTVGDANWVSIIESKNYDEIDVLSVDSSGNLYVGGLFTTAGGVAANNIAKWNGSTWSALGSGVNDYVYALALDSSGDLYAGGNFTTAGGVTVNHIAKWNGSAWSALGTGMNGSVYTLVVDGSGNLYAGGGFTSAGGVSNTTDIAKWNGSAWSALGSGMNDTVEVLAVDGSGNLYAGGAFVKAGGVVANHIAKWNGASWGALGGLNYGVFALAFDSTGNLYALESYINNGSVDGYIVKWNGSAWSTLGSTTLYASNGGLVADNKGNVFASVVTVDGLTVDGIAKWDGATWSVFAQGVNGGYIIPLMLDRSANMYAGGGFAASIYAAKYLLPGHVKNDFDADGKSDALFLNSTSGATQYWKSATKSQSVYPGVYDMSYTYAGSGDFNADGKADLFFTKASNNGTLIWSGTVKSATSYPGTSTAGFSVVAICDTNGDGKDDVVWSNASTGATQIWPAATKASATYPGVQSTAYTIAACADFDGDGKADLFWRNNTSGGNQIWSGANKANILYPGTLPDSSWSVMGAGDTNGDGKDDLVWYQAQNPLDPSIGSIAIWLGGIKAQAIYPGSNGNALVPAAIGDYNGDGKADLLWINSGTHGIEIWSGVRKGQAYESYPGIYATGFAVQK